MHFLIESEKNYYLRSSGSCRKYYKVVLSIVFTWKILQGEE
jgi:hypothetical protein